MVKIYEFVVVIIILKECFHPKMRGMTNKEKKVLGNRNSVQLCARGRLLYLNPHVIRAPGLTECHGDGLVHHVGRGLTRDSIHGPKPLLLLPPFDLTVIAAGLEWLAGS